LNRILFERGEIGEGGVAAFGGERAAHVLDILHGEPGQILKTGEIGGRRGTAEILSISGGVVTVRVRHDCEAPPPWADLILAPPRPRILKRLLPQLAAMGAGRIVLAGAKKVEKDFWGATLLKEENYRPLLVEGLMQAGATALPEIETRRNFRKFVAEELDGMFPGSMRIVAHPAKDGGSASSLPAGGGRPLVAIGPEGGWLDEEVELLESKGFARFSLGERILKTETAAIALLAVVSQAVRDRSSRIREGLR